MKSLYRQLILLTLMAVAPGAFASQSESAITESQHLTREMLCLAQNVYFEARGEPTEGQLAVAMVTMNRVKSDVYPDSVCKVVWQRRQFSWTHDGKSDSPTDREAWRLAKQIAEFVFSKYGELQGRSNGALDLTKGALYYYAPKLANPRWANYKEVTREIGNHVFLKSRS